MLFNVGKGVVFMNEGCNEMDVLIMVGIDRMVGVVGGVLNVKYLILVV